MADWYFQRETQQSGSHQLPNEARFQDQSRKDQDIDDDYRPRNPRRESTSTLGSTNRRHSHYDTQRLERRSHPSSIRSQNRSRSRTHGPSYQQPGDYENVDETALPPPLPAYEGGQQSSQTVRNFSQPLLHRKGQSSSTTKDQPPSDMSALPPLPSSTKPYSAQAAQNVQGQRIPEDAENGDASDDNTRRPYSSKQSEKPAKPPPAPVPKWQTELFTMSYLIFFSFIGTLIRLGMQWITFYPGAPITTPVIWANVLGSVIFGFISEDQALFKHPSQAAALAEAEKREIDKLTLMKHKKTIPLYIGLATGLCGSITSFSSFARDFFLALSNNLPAPVYHSYTSSAGTVSPTMTVSRNGGYSFEAMLAVIIYTLALSLGGLFFGAHLALFLEGWTKPIPVSFIRKVLDPLMVFLAWGCWLGAVLLCILPPDRPSGPSSRGSWSNETWRGEVLFALAFAPIGCLLRFYVSLKMNSLVDTFPLGTFVVNMFGTAVESMCYDIQHVGVGYLGRVGGGRVGCQVLQGVQDGFCGCLTTISTFVAEIDALKRKHGYIYALGSVLGALGLTVIIMGSVRWEVGFSSPVCNTGYTSKLHG